MTWTKLSDDFTDDCDTLSDAAFRLHVEGLVWSNRKLLDCRLPKDRLQRYTTHPDLVTELLDAGWWAEDGEHYVIRHHAGYQRNREEVIAQQEANRRNGRRGGRPSKASREQALSSETQSVSESPSESRTHRDGTGRDRTGSLDGTTTQQNVRECGWCHGSFVPSRAGQVTHDDVAECSRLQAGAA